LRFSPYLLLFNCIHFRAFSSSRASASATPPGPPAAAPPGDDSEADGIGRGASGWVPGGGGGGRGICGNAICEPGTGGFPLIIISTLGTKSEPAKLHTLSSQRSPREIVFLLPKSAASKQASLPENSIKNPRNQTNKAAKILFLKIPPAKSSESFTRSLASSLAKKKKLSQNPLPARARCFANPKKDHPPKSKNIQILYKVQNGRLSVSYP
jgi:hypothetical protein